MIEYRSHIENCDRLLQILLSSTAIPLWDALARGNISEECGIYRIFEGSQPFQTLYVGKTLNLRKRICGDLLAGDEQSHTLSGKLAVSFNLIDKAAVRDFLERWCECHIVAVCPQSELSPVEHYAIAALRPRLNDETRSDAE